MSVLETLNFNDAHAIPVLLALVGSVYSIYTDVKTRKIKNYITFPLIIIGWASGFAFGFKAGLINILLSCLIGILATRVGMVGAGDIKLIVGISACLRTPNNFLFLAAFYIVLAFSCILSRFYIHRFNPIKAFKAIMTEIKLELAGLGWEAGRIAHGQDIRNLGAPVIFAALILTLFRPFIL